MRFQARSANLLHILMRHSCGDDAALLRNQIKRKKAEFFSLDNCHFVTRSEITTRGKELVICCAEGKELKGPVRALISKAKALGFEYLRYHPKSRAAGLAMARMAGIKVTEVTEQSAYYMLTDLRG